MTIRKGSENLFFKLEVACAPAVIAWSKPGYTVLQSLQKTVVSVFVLSPLTP